MHNINQLKKKTFMCPSFHYYANNKRVDIRVYCVFLLLVLTSKS